MKITRMRLLITLIVVLTLILCTWVYAFLFVRSSQAQKGVEVTLNTLNLPNGQRIYSRKVDSGCRFVKNYPLYIPIPECEWAGVSYFGYTNSDVDAVLKDIDIYLKLQKFVWNGLGDNISYSKKDDFKERNIGLIYQATTLQKYQSSYTPMTCYNPKTVLAADNDYSFISPQQDRMRTLIDHIYATEVQKISSLQDYSVVCGYQMTSGYGL